MGAAKSESKSMPSYLVGAFVEWVLILMLLLNSFFYYLIFRFAHYFRLNKPCLCCSSSAFLRLSLPQYDTATDLLCHRHAALIASAAAPRHDKDDDDDDDAFRDVGRNRLLSTADDKSTRFIRDLYSNEKVVEFSFTEEEDDDEYVQKDIVQGDGHRVLLGGDDGFYAFSEAEPLIDVDDNICCLGRSHDEPACAVANWESTLIKHKKVNDDECYSIAYTNEGDLVMDLCRNTKSVLASSDTADAIPQIKATPEQQADELSHQCANFFVLIL